MYLVVNHLQRNVLGRISLASSRRAARALPRMNPGKQRPLGGCPKQATAGAASDGRNNPVIPRKSAEPPIPRTVFARLVRDCRTNDSGRAPTASRNSGIENRGKNAKGIDRSIVSGSGPVQRGVLTTASRRFWRIKSHKWLTVCTPDSHHAILAAGDKELAIPGRGSGKYIVG